MRTFKVGDEIFFYQERDRNKNGILIKAGKSKVAKIVCDETLSKRQGDFMGYLLANGGFVKEEEAFTKAGFEQKIRGFLDAK